MKINIKNTALHILLLLTGAHMYSSDPPPAPNEEPLPDGPINENINTLLIVALLFGIYIIYKHMQKNKRPI